MFVGFGLGKDNCAELTSSRLSGHVHIFKRSTYICRLICFRGTLLHPVTVEENAALNSVHAYKPGNSGCELFRSDRSLGCIQTGEWP